jgi:hypothetical protein
MTSLGGEPDVAKQSKKDRQAFFEKYVNLSSEPIPYVVKQYLAGLLLFVKLMMRLITVLVLSVTICQAQTESVILILTNKKANVLLDGEAKGECQANIPFKLVTSAGEHYAQVQYEQEGTVVDKGEVVVIESGKQKILKLMFDELIKPASQESIKVADINFSIPGTLAVAAWNQDHPNEHYPYPTHYFAFEKGDIIVLNTSMTNKKGTNIIEIATYPGNVIKYSNNKFSELTNVEIRVEERSIYRITFATNHTFDRNCFLQIGRRPTSPEASAFNTSVILKKIYTPVQVIEPQSVRVNSGSNATLLGGKSRVLVPVTLPPNTIEWFYRFSASRSQADIDNVQQNFALLGELSKLLLSASGFGVVAANAVDIGVEQLSTPPGADYADIYLLKREQTSNFLAKVDYEYVLDGTRENIMSGNVKITCCNQGQFYLGIKNPDTYHAVNVSLEVVAVTESEELVMAGE